MESIKGHPEHVETVFGEAIVARDESLVVLASASGLGPPDLCWLQKAPKSALTGASGEAKGYYHCCLGVDASSSAAVAAYFSTLTSLVEPPTFLQGLFSISEVRVERGFYCCYDPLTRLDVRCELCIPGGVVCGALDCEGNVHDVTPELWRNCVVATFLRAELYDAELVSHSQVPVVRIPPLPGPVEESQLLAAVAGLYEDGVLPEALDALTIDQHGGVAPEHGDMVLHSLLHYFAKRQRWRTALDFFVRLASTYPTAALYVAAVQRDCGLYEDALTTLYGAVGEFPDDPVLLAGLATECLYAEQIDASLRFAMMSTRLRPSLRSAWLALARAHVRQYIADPGFAAGTAGAMALVVLNLVPPPPVPGRESAMLHVIVPPDPKSVTKPIVPPYDLDVALARLSLAEEGFLHSASSSPSSGPPLPGALLVPREAPDSGSSPDISPMRISKAVMAAIYKVLQELVAVCGWDGFLRLRSSVFVMHADSDILREQQRAAEERERKLRLLHRQLSATLPGSPCWPVAQRSQPQLAPPLSPQQQKQVLASGTAPQPGVNFHTALDEAAMMGLAEYPEHLEDEYSDPRVIVARETHRRHLREITERQARLEAVEDGAYADDEWDGSSTGSDGRQRGSTCRLWPSRHNGRRTPIVKNLRTRQTGPDLTRQMQGTEIDSRIGPHEDNGMEGEERPCLELAASGEAVTLPLPYGVGVVDAGEMVREEAVAASVAAAAGANTLVSQSRNTQQTNPLEPAALPPQPLQVGVGGVSKLAPPLHARMAQSSTSGTWWGTLFGAAGAGGIGGSDRRVTGGGGGAAVAQGREPRPLGEAVELGWQPNVCRSGGDCLLASEAQAQALHLQDPATCSQASGNVGRGACDGWRRKENRLPSHGSADGSIRAGGGFWSPEPTVAASTAGCCMMASRWVVCSELAALTPRRSAVGGVHPWRTTPRVSCSVPAPVCSFNEQPHGLKAAAVEAANAAGTDVGRSAPGRASVLNVLAAIRSLGRSTPYVKETHSSRQDGGGSACSNGLDDNRRGGCSTSRQAHRLQQRWWRLWRRRGSRISTPTAAHLLHCLYTPRMPLLLALWKAPSGSGGVGSTMNTAVALSGCRSLKLVPSEGGQCRSKRFVWHNVRQVYGPGPVAESGVNTAAPDAAAITAAVTDAASAGAAPNPATDGLASVFGTATAIAAAAAAPDTVVDGDPVNTDAGGPPHEVDSYPFVLQNLDTDRHMVLEGMDVTELGAKRLCGRWLDELIVALWHDLQAFLDWRALDAELAEAGFRSHSDIVSGAAPAPTTDDYHRFNGTASSAAADEGGGGNSGSTGAPTSSLPRPPQLPVVSCMEWLRRGMLAERLHHEADALAAYQAAVMTPPPLPAAAAFDGGGALFACLPGSGPGAFSMIAWEGIMRLAPATDPRDIPWALRAVHAVMTWLDTRGAAAVVSAASAVPFTTGFISALIPGGTAGGGTGRIVPTTGKLQACPLPVVYSLHLVAAVLGESGVEAAVAAAQQPTVAAAAPAKSGISSTAGGSSTATKPQPAIHPAAAALLQHAVRAAATGSGANRGTGSYESSNVSGPLAGAGLVSAISVRNPQPLLSAAAATVTRGGGGNGGSGGSSDGVRGGGGNAIVTENIEAPA